MKLTKLVALGLVAFSLYGCASESADASDVGSDNAAVTGSMKRAQAVVMRDAYVAADVTKLTPLNPDMSTVPEAARAMVQNWVALNPTFTMKVDSVASLQTPVGKVFIVERTVTDPTWHGYERELDFFDEFGTWRVYGVESFKWDYTPSDGMHYFWVSETPGTDQAL